MEVQAGSASSLMHKELGLSSLASKQTRKEATQYSQRQDAVSLGSFAPNITKTGSKIEERNTRFCGRERCRPKDRNSPYPKIAHKKARTNETTRIAARRIFIVLNGNSASGKT